MIIRFSIEICVAATLAMIVRIFFFSVGSIASSSMLPTVVPGDWVVTHKWPKSGPLPATRGDVVTFTSPQDPERLVIKRIIGLPGDIIEVRAGRLWVNNQPHTLFSETSPPLSRQILKQDQYFMLGDNHEMSDDSRTYGPIPRALIEGRARWVLINTNGWPTRVLHTIGGAP